MIFFNTFEKIYNKNGENSNFISKLSCNCKILYGRECIKIFITVGKGSIIMSIKQNEGSISALLFYLLLY